MSKNMVEYEVHVRDMTWEPGQSSPEDWVEYTWARSESEAFIMVRDRLSPDFRPQYANPVI